MSSQQLYQTLPAEQCTCPIHRHGDPMTLPKGVEFADRVTIEVIDESTAGEIYREHHSYCPELPNVTFEDGNHGVYFQGELVGAISYNYPLLSKLKLYLEENTFHRNSNRGTDETKTIVTGDRIAQAARICIGVDFPNLASCAFAKSQDKFIHETDKEFDWLLTFIRTDHVGHMLKALIGKGWNLVGITDTDTAPSNREHRDIHSYSKARWIRPIGDPIGDITDCRCTDDQLSVIGKSYICQDCHSWYGYTGYDWAPNN